MHYTKWSNDESLLEHYKSFYAPSFGPFFSFLQKNQRLWICVIVPHQLAYNPAALGWITWKVCPHDCLLAVRCVSNVSATSATDLPQNRLVNNQADQADLTEFSKALTYVS